jgi:tRNA nucleotidyltransferase/poly(A) polymerase
MNFADLVPEWLIQAFESLADPPPIWLVGGALRDAMLGKQITDLDFAVNGEARQTARRLADALGEKYFTLDAQSDTGRVIFDHPRDGIQSLDLTALRRNTITEDLRARDFTFNAMAVSVTAPADLIDPCEGAKDLAMKIVRVCNPHSITSDPIRAVRAVRMALKFGLGLEPETLKLVRSGGQLLMKVSPERIRDEVFRLFELPYPGKAIRLLDHLGLVRHVFQDLFHLKNPNNLPSDELDDWKHTLAVLDHLGEILQVLSTRADPDLSADLILGEAVLRLGRFRSEIESRLVQTVSSGHTVRQLLFLAGLYHKAQRPKTTPENGAPRGSEIESVRAAQAMGRTMRLSSKEIRLLEITLRQQTWPVRMSARQDVTCQESFRFFRTLGEAGIDVCLLSLADLLGKTFPPVDQTDWGNRLRVVQSLLERNYQGSMNRFPELLVRGDELIELLHLKAGPLVGELLEKILEAQVCGEIKTRSQAISLAKSEMQK